MTQQPKPWFRLKLRDDLDNETCASVFSKLDIDLTNVSLREFVVYGASPMINFEPREM